MRISDNRLANRALLALPGAVVIALGGFLGQNVIEQAYFAWTVLAIYGIGWICFSGE